MKKKLKIISSILILGVFVFFALSSGKTNNSSDGSNQKQSIVVKDWSSEQSVIEAMQGKWYCSSFIISDNQGKNKSIESIVNINGNTINVSDNIQGKGYKDWGRPGETFTLDVVEEYNPCSSMKETEHTQRYDFSIKSGGNLEVRNSDGDCLEKFEFNGKELYR